MATIMLQFFLANTLLLLALSSFTGNVVVVVHGFSASSVATATTTSGATATTTTKAAELLQKYLDDHGAIRHCEIGSTKFGRGLVATRNLKAGEIALRIPISCALVEPDNLGDDEENNHWAGRLALKVMKGRKSGRSNCVYTNALPEPPCTPVRGDCWPTTNYIQEFDDIEFENEIDTTIVWRYKQWEIHCSSGKYNEEDRQPYLDALDLVCSRTIRCGNDLMLVPLLDMANHASQEENGGYYKRDGCDICLMVGERGVKIGEEITLDYGQRQNKDWIIHYGFIPTRNNIEYVTLPKSGKRVTLQDARSYDAATPSIQQECNDYLQTFKTTLEEDILMLRESQVRNNLTKTTIIECKWHSNIELHEKRFFLQLLDQQEYHHHFLQLFPSSTLPRPPHRHPIL